MDRNMVFLFGGIALGILFCLPFVVILWIERNEAQKDTTFLRGHRAGL